MGCDKARAMEPIGRQALIRVQPLARPLPGCTTIEHVKHMESGMYKRLTVNTEGMFFSMSTFIVGFQDSVSTSEDPELKAIARSGTMNAFPLCFTKSW